MVLVLLGTGRKGLIQKVNVSLFYMGTIVVEKLGKVLWLGDSGRSGIFLNPQRGLFFYDSYTDKFMPVSAADPRLPHSVEIAPERHVVFGTIDMFLHFLKNLGYTTLLKEIFPS